jgi:hypothetical protein
VWRGGGFRLTGWEEVDSVLRIIAPTVYFSYKLADIAHGFKGPDGVCFGSATRNSFHGHSISRVIASEVHGQLGHAGLEDRRM